MPGDSFCAPTPRATVGRAIGRGEFDDPGWVEEWDVEFAALPRRARRQPRRWADRPAWRLAFEARRTRAARFADPALLERRRRDHERIDGVLASLVAAEDNELPARMLLTPLNRLAAKRFLSEARRKVWHNAHEPNAARVAGPDAYRTRLAELEVLSAATLAEPRMPGQVLLRLAVAGFGIILPPPA